MLPFVGIAATLGVIVSVVWFAWSLLKAMFPASRAAAVRGIKRSALAFVACVAVAVTAAVTDVSNLPAAGDAAVRQVTATETNDDDTEVAVVLPDTSPSPSARPADAPAAAPAADEVKRLSSSQEFVWIRNNQRLLAQKLRDPGSAQFSGDRVSYKSGAPVVCGTVNAKNAFGGYTGAERWVGMGTTVGVFLASEVEGFDSLWNRVC